MFSALQAAQAQNTIEVVRLERLPEVFCTERNDVLRGKSLFQPLLLIITINSLCIAIASTLK
ncbi:MAG: hypothetical protein O4803_14840 [Trichodesmium sp. St15_bin1_1]|nr:hypothetical protein [Trichodesmium sp. St15_bin1_1]MDE5118000.1 hypothetical protein [Trichodesmium sp. St2_bin2_1]